MGGRIVGHRRGDLIQARGEILPQAERAAELGLDPTPMLAVAADVLRLYAGALEHREPIDR
jgi:hypothetical protein